MTGKLVNRVAAGAAAAAGVLMLAACGSGPTQVGATTTTASTTTTAQPTSKAHEAVQTTTAAAARTPRCTTADLSLTLGTPRKHDDGSGQVDVPLTYKNKSSRTCALHGVPGVDLLGPDDPNGPVYHLPRVDNGVEDNEVPPGTTATATVTVLTPTDGSVGSEGSKSWTPTTLKTIPPGQTTALSAGWPSSVPVLRQDEATHPGSFVNGILADPS